MFPGRWFPTRWYARRWWPEPTASTVVAGADTLDVPASALDPGISASAESPTVEASHAMSTLTRLGSDDYPWYPGEDRPIDFTMTDGSVVTGWTIHVRMSKTPDGATLINLGSASITGTTTFSVALDGATTDAMWKAGTLTQRLYYFEARRVDSGHNRVLAVLEWPLLSPAVVLE